MSKDPSPPPARAAGGLQGVVAAPSEICYIDGVNGRLVYRGYEIGDLVEHCSFEEVAFLLWENRLPSSNDLRDLRKQLGEQMQLPPHLLALLKALPASMQPMDALRTAISAAGAGDPDLTDNSPESNRRKAVRLTAQLPTIVGAFHRVRNGKDPIAPDPSLTIAANFLRMIDGRTPHATHVRTMDAALVLHAEHGMNASTFAARVTAATLADMHAAITAATAALKGPLHGGANQDVMELLQTCTDADDAEKKVRAMIADKKKIPGFGHRVYRTTDPRAGFLRDMSKEVGQAAGDLKWYEMSQRLIGVAKDAKNLNPNVDFFSASTYYTMGIPLDLFTPVFAVARVTGWTAHVIEQQINNRIIRPTDEYLGLFGRQVVPIDQRT